MLEPSGEAPNRFHGDFIVYYVCYVDYFWDMEECFRRARAQSDTMTLRPEYHWHCRSQNSSAEPPRPQIDNCENRVARDPVVGTIVFLAVCSGD